MIKRLYYNTTIAASSLSFLENAVASISLNGGSSGLQVIIVSTNDRPMHHMLDDSGYVGKSGTVLRNHATY